MWAPCSAVLGENVLAATSVHLLAWVRVGSTGLPSVLTPPPRDQASKGANLRFWHACPHNSPKEIGSYRAVSRAKFNQLSCIQELCG